MNSIYIRSAQRTSIGALTGSLSTIPAPQLGSTVIRSAVASSSVAVSDIQACYMGNVLPAGTGQAPARQAALGAGLDDSTHCSTINKVCGSGMECVVSAARSILTGEVTHAVAGGMENMSQAPHLLPAMRNGVKLGNSNVIDSLVHDGLWDPYHDQHMGNCGEACASEYSLTREAQDRFATMSYQRAQSATSEGKFNKEITPVTITSPRGDITVDTDESPAQVNFDKLPKLRPFFQKDGTITAANASSINDGAAALVLSSESGESNLGRIVAWAHHSREPIKFTSAPIGAIEALLEKTAWTVDGVDLWEINEAFAVVPMCAISTLGIDINKVNIHGGAIALGHPIGASGARILVTLAHAMEQQKVTRGVAAICIGGGEAIAIAIERNA